MNPVEMRSEGAKISISSISAVGDSPDEVYKAIEIAYGMNSGFDDFIDFYNIDDIFLLRDAIDAFISRNNLTPPVK